MKTKFEGVNHYDEKQCEWQLEVCPFDYAVDNETNIEKVWSFYKDAQEALSAYVKELVELQASMRYRMAERVANEDIANLYG